MKKINKSKAVTSKAVTSKALTAKDERSLLCKLHPESVTSKALTASGITLIALIVTIIILLILAGIALNLISGSEGILGRATSSVDRYEAEAAQEQLEMEIMNADFEQLSATGQRATFEDLIDKYSNSANYTIAKYSVNGELVDDVILPDELDSIDYILVVSNENPEITLKISKDKSVTISDQKFPNINRYPKISIRTTVDELSITTEVTNVENVGSLPPITYTLQKPDGTVLQEITTTDRTFSYGGLDTSTMYTITAQVSNEYGTKKARNRVKTISLYNYTKGGAYFDIYPEEEWQATVRASIITTFKPTFTILQYRIGNKGSWEDYYQAFNVNENTTIYGRYYDPSLNEVGYTFSFNIKIIDEEPPVVSVEATDIQGKKITVKATATDAKIGMPATPVYDYYISTDGTNYEKKASVTANTYTFTKLKPETKYYIKVVSYDFKGNEGTSPVINAITLEAPEIASIKLDKTTYTIVKDGTVQLNVSGKTTKNVAVTADELSVIWTSSNENVATVSNTGLVTGVAANANPITITCTLEENEDIKATCSITVKVGTEIRSRSDLAAIPDKATGYYVIMNDIQMGSTEWTPLTNFKGTLDGNGYTINGLTITSSTTNSALFKDPATGATFKNFKLDNVNINVSKGMAAALCTFPNSQQHVDISNVGVIGTVKTDSGKAGGIVAITGNNQTYLTIEDCYFRGAVSNAGADCGGIAGGAGLNNNSATGNIKRSYFSGTIDYGIADKNLIRIGPISCNNDNANAKLCRMNQTNCYYNSSLFAKSGEWYSTGLTTAQFADSSNFSGWDFTNTWTIHNGYPELQIFLER